MPSFEEIDDNISFWSEMILINHFDIIFKGIKGTYQTFKIKMLIKKKKNKILSN